jgi:uncharacterized protein YjaG (DUF416 family)
MNLHFFDLETLKKDIQELPSFHRVAFAASCCERMFPYYKAFSRMYNWGNPSIPGVALDQVWKILQGKDVDEAIINQLIEDCGQEDIYPNDLDFSGKYCYEAQETLEAICKTLEVLLKDDSELILMVVKHARNAIEAHVSVEYENLKLSENGREKFRNAIANHPFAVREIAKETEDLQRLKAAQILDRDVLEWLRASSKKDGKNLIDLP